MNLFDSKIPIARDNVDFSQPKAQEVRIVIPGAVSVGVKCKDGVVLGNERRVIWGYTVLSKNVKKIYRIGENIGLTVSGLISDMQMMVKIMRVYFNLFELESGSPMSVKAFSKYLASFLYQRKMAPLYTQVIVAGVDKDGLSLYTLDPVGSLIPEDIAATGTGTTLAISILESKYDPDMTVEEGKVLVEEAIVNSVKRDATTGDGLDILIITKDGSQGLSKDISDLM